MAIALCRSSIKPYLRHRRGSQRDGGGHGFGLFGPLPHPHAGQGGKPECSGSSGGILMFQLFFLSVLYAHGKPRYTICNLGIAMGGISMDLGPG